MIKNILKRIADKLGYMVLKKGLPIDMLPEKDFISIMEKCEDYTMVASDKSFGLYKAVEYIARAGIEGDFVECGVWKGGQTMMMAYGLMNEGQYDRKLWLYDTYTGMSEPTEVDVYAYPDDPALEKWKNLDRDDHNAWCYAPLDEVKKNVYATGYPRENFSFIQGKVEDTLPAQAPEKIALLRLDTDWYESTYHELEHLYPRLVPGGVLLIDDYGSWEGARKAVDEYILKHKAKILLTKIGQGRVGVKIA